MAFLSPEWIYLPRPAFQAVFEERLRSFTHEYQVSISLFSCYLHGYLDAPDAKCSQPRRTDEPLSLCGLLDIQSICLALESTNSWHCSFRARSMQPHAQHQLSSLDHTQIEQLSPQCPCYMIKATLRLRARPWQGNPAEKDCCILSCPKSGKVPDSKGEGGGLDFCILFLVGTKPILILHDSMHCYCLMQTSS